MSGDDRQNSPSISRQNRPSATFGHSVPVYDMERTICDLLRSRKNVEMQVFQDALKQYAKRKDKNLRMLMKYAAMFHVENILRPYLEVLL